MVVTAALMLGCAGPGSNTVAGNVATGATINALAGVPGAGLVGAVAMIVDAATKPGPRKAAKVKISPELLQMFEESPTCNTFCKHWKERRCADAELEVFWRSRKKKDGSLITVDNAPKRSMEYTEAAMKAANKYLAGIFGDTPEEHTKNLKAKAEGKMFVAVYHSPNNANIIYVSKNNGPADIMTAEEWAARKAAAVPAKPEVAKEPANVSNDNPADKKESDSDSSAQPMAPKDPVSASTVDHESDTEPHGKN